MLVDLVRAAHPGPSLLVTGVVAALGAAAGVAPARLAVLLVAVAAGQAAIGWTNDWHDVAQDRAGGRRDKPLVGDDARITRRTVGVAAAVALVVAVTASLLVGGRAGWLHLVAVAAGLAHDLGAKTTAWSWLPWAIAFGLLPAATVATLPGAPAAAWWAVLAAAGFGVGVHLANALPDLDADAAAGVRGLPQRLGPLGCASAAAAILLAGAAIALVGGAVPMPWLAVVAAVVVALAAAIPAATRRGRRELAYRMALVLSLVVVGVLVARGGAIAA